MAVRSAGDEGNVQEQDVTYFDVPANRGSHTLMVTPDPTPPRPLWKRLLCL
jgi:hypothetical protein